MGTFMGSSWFIPPIKMVMNGGWCRWHCFTHMKAKTKPIPIFFTNGLYKSSRYGFHCFMKICRSCVFYPFRGCCKRGLFDFIMSISHHSRVPGTSSACSARNSGCLHPIFNPQKTELDETWMKIDEEISGILAFSSTIDGIPTSLVAWSLRLPVIQRKRHLPASTSWPWNVWWGPICIYIYMYI